MDMNRILLILVCIMSAFGMASFILFFTMRPPTVVHKEEFNPILKEAQEIRQEAVHKQQVSLNDIFNRH